MSKAPVRYICDNCGTKIKGKHRPPQEIKVELDDGKIATVTVQLFQGGKTSMAESDLCTECKDEILGYAMVELEK